jgi:hypothetical protein
MASWAGQNRLGNREFLAVRLHHYTFGNLRENDKKYFFKQ